MEYVITAYTDRGICREHNQDSFCARRASLPGGGEAVMAVVCDGMGGLQKGELASAAAVRAFGGWFDNSLQRLPVLCASGFEPVQQEWEALISKLHSRLLAYSQQHGVQIGTTLAIFFAYGSRYLLVNVGDSRIYENKYQLIQLTQDQSLVAREVSMGRITADEARHHPQRNVLLQCLGAGESVVPAFSQGNVLGNAVYLLCTDGFSHEVTPSELQDQLNPLRLGTKDAMTMALGSLTETCKQRGESDNITSLLLKASESQYVPEKKGLSSLFQKLSGKKPVPQTAVSLLETVQITHTKEDI